MFFFLAALEKRETDMPRLSLCVCVYIYIYIYIYIYNVYVDVSMYICLVVRSQGLSTGNQYAPLEPICVCYLSLYACVYIYIHACIVIWMHACMSVYMYVRTYVPWARACMRE